MHNAVNIRWLHLITKSMRLLNLVKEKSISMRWNHRRTNLLVLWAFRGIEQHVRESGIEIRDDTVGEMVGLFTAIASGTYDLLLLSTNEMLLTFPSVFAYSLWSADRVRWFLPPSVDTERWEARRKQCLDNWEGRVFTWCSLLIKCQSRERLSFSSSGSLISISTLFSNVFSFSTESVRCRFRARLPVSSK